MSQAATIAIVDYGMGNLWSVRNAIEAAAPNHRVVVTNSDDEIDTAERLVIPGQGAAADCMREIERSGVARRMPAWIAGGKPIFGICMGLQVLFNRSAENGGVDCLGLVDGTVERFETDPSGERKVPHMGWNRVSQKSHALWDGVDDGSHFYFANSYYVAPTDDAVVTGSTEYGVEFCSAIAFDNVFACQFHPEKSADAGLRLLRNFVSWTPRSGSPI